MTKILVLTTRDIVSDGGEKTLMLNKQRELEHKGVDFCYWLFRRNTQGLSKWNEDNGGGHKFFNTWSLLNKKKILKELESRFKEAGEFDVVLVSGVWLYFLHKELAGLKQQFGFKLHVDFQGAAEELVEYGGGGAKLLFYLVKRWEKKVFQYCDCAEIVAENAIKYLSNEYGYEGDTAHVPCGVSRAFDFSEYDNHRAKWRKTLGMSPCDIGVVYAGGASAWQNINELISMAKNNPAVLFYLFMSAPIKEAVPANVKIKSLPHALLVEALCAFDYGFLFRDHDVTNYVAWPNKFSEYVNARLVVLLKNREIGFYSKDYECDHLIQISDETTVLENRCKGHEKKYEKHIDGLLYKRTVSDLHEKYLNA